MKAFNMDFSKRVLINSNTQEWIESKTANCKYVPLELEEGEQGRRTSFVLLKECDELSGLLPNSSKEMIIFSGQLTDGKNHYSDRTYIRLPVQSDLRLMATEDTKVFIKENAGDPNDQETVIVNTQLKEWGQGHGNLKVMELYDQGEENAALVLWPKGERFVPHRHWGGEEIFVLTGEFIDEHSRYPAGTWIRSPHLSTHFPFVEKETIILVKTGHLLPPKKTEI